MSRSSSANARVTGAILIAERIRVTGNTVIDALLNVVQRLEQDMELASEAAAPTEFLDSSRRFILVTGL